MCVCGCPPTEERDVIHTLKSSHVRTVQLTQSVSLFKHLLILWFLLMPSVTTDQMASWKLCQSPPYSWVVRNELTTATAHARVGTVVHTQLIWSSLWKKNHKDGQSDTVWNKGRKLFPFSTQALKDNNKTDLSKDSLNEQREAWGVGGKGHKAVEEWTGSSSTGVGLILLNLRCQDVSFHPELY